MRKLLCILCALAICAGCGGRAADFEMRRRPMTPAGVTQLMRQAKKSPPGPLTAAEYVSARSDAIASFVETAKDQGAQWRSLAKTLDEVTPAESKNQALPVKVVRAPFSGRTAWIIVQSWGKPNAVLPHAKVWVMNVKDGSLLYAASEL